MTTTIENRGQSTARLTVSACLAFALGAGSTGTVASTVGDHQLGTKFSSLSQINRGNVTQLEKAWEFHNGDDPTAIQGLVALEDQPTLIEGNLIVCSVHRRVIALDPATGEQRWEYDPEDPMTGMRKCRGVGNWVDPQAEEGSLCKSRSADKTNGDK